MSKHRLESFSDGVIAIIITIMVLELKIPKGADWSALYDLLPYFLSYLLSFIFTGIYWNNHHHMMTMVTHVNGRILWANMHLLFWLSLVPVATGWLGENGFAQAPTATYGILLLLCAVAYKILVSAILQSEGPNSRLARALGRDLKGKLSPLLYMAAIALAFLAPRVADALFVTVAIIWLVPDRRIERSLEHEVELQHK